jgi:hypothetical protein
VQLFYIGQLRVQFRHDPARYRDGPALSAFSLDREHARIEIKILHPHLDSLKTSQTAPVLKLGDKLINMPHPGKNLLYLITGKHHRDVGRLFRAGNVLVVAEITF